MIWFIYKARIEVTSSYHGASSYHRKSIFLIIAVSLEAVSSVVFLLCHLVVEVGLRASRIDSELGKLFKFGPNSMSVVTWF